MANNTNNGWNDIGKQIRDTVQNAIDSQDFKQLNETISQVVNVAMKNVKDGVSQAAAKSETQRNWRETTRRENREHNVVAVQGLNKPALYARRPIGTYSGIAVAAAGFSVAAIFFPAAISLLAGSLITNGAAQTGYMLAAIFMGVIGVGGVFVGGKGIGLRKRALRFRKYVELMGDHEYFAIQDFATQTGKSVDYVLRDLKEMINQRMFLSGRLDDQRTHLIASNEAYEQYKLMQQSNAKRAAVAMAEQQANEQVINRTDISDDVRKIIIEGRSYIAHVHQCNEDIPGEEFSNKLDRLEEIMKRIFAQVEKYPDKAPELHKFMNYYLPTTTKLIDAYRDIDEHPVAGENTANTKHEIEDTLDTINDAFEKLLDRSFAEQAMDISSDISVMKTMLAKEGLTEDELTIDKNRATKDKQ